MALVEMNPNDLKFEIEEETAPGAKFKVIGVGGGGSNAVARMVGEGLEGVEFCVVNTDLQALRASPVPRKLQIGAKLTGGLGAGSDPSIGKQAALDDTEKIIELLEGAQMIFIAAALGGGTGTGAAPVVASLAKEMGALTVAVATKPFAFEGPAPAGLAERGLAELASTVDIVVAIPNDRLLALLPRGTTLLDSFKAADDVLRQAVQGIRDIIHTPGLVNRDFANIRRFMQGMGIAVMGTAAAEGENAAVEAARAAINCPLMDERGIAGAGRVLANISGSAKLGLHEVSEACTLIREATGRSDVQFTFGVVLDDGLKDAVKVTVIATAFDRSADASSKLAVVEPTPPPEPEAAAETPAGPAPQVLAMAAPAGEIDEDDVDTPAYLRRDKLLF